MSAPKRPADGRDVAIGRLKAKVGDLTMANELLEVKIEQLEAGHPLATAEVEAMSHVVSPSTNRSYGVLQVTRVWGTSRATMYRHRRQDERRPRCRPGPLGPMPDEALVEAIRDLLAASPRLAPSTDVCGRCGAARMVRATGKSGHGCASAASARPSGVSYA